MIGGDWESLQAFEWIRELRSCPQDPIHHAEGDVWIHTRMVLEALQAGPAFAEAGDGERGILWAAAALHDVAKPVTTRQEPGGRMTAHGHSAKGALRARRILWELGVPFREREAVCGLVLHHQVPFFLVERDDARRLCAHVSLSASWKLLTALAEADIRGRLCSDAERVLDNIALAAELSKELDCWDRPRPFPSGLARFEYFQTESRDIDYAAFDSTRFEVIVLCGLPGAGKDHWAALHAKGLPVVSLDALRDEFGVAAGDNQGAIVQAARERARVFLRRREPFVWNATNVTRQMRAQVISLVVGYGARVRLVYVECGYQTLLDQNRGRVRVVPPEVLERLMGKWEVPTIEEAHAVEYHVR